MGYPKQYSPAAIRLAEIAIDDNVPKWLVKTGWEWSARPYLISSTDYARIKDRFLPDVNDDEVLRLIGIAFSRRRPAQHMELTSDGYKLALERFHRFTSVVVRKTHTCWESYPNDTQDDVRKAAQAVVRALIVWRLEKNHWLKNPTGPWPHDGENGADLIYGSLYRTIRQVADSPCCMRTTVDFVLSAVPDLHEAWETAGLRLVPRYSAERDGRDRLITLRLTSTPA